MLVAADRAALLAALDDYMGERIDSAAFDARLAELYASRDGTVASIAQHLWCCYDDCTDHLIAGAKPLWDQLVRFRLVLLSGGELRTQRHRHWHAAQAVAALALLALAAIWRWSPQHLLIAWLGAGLLSLALAGWQRRWRERIEPRSGPEAWPFAGVGAIRRALARVPGFRKPPLPPQVAARRIRSRFAERAMRFQFGALWLIGAPIALLCQTVPNHVWSTHVVPASGEAGEDDQRFAGGA